MGGRYSGQHSENGITTTSIIQLPKSGSYNVPVLNIIQPQHHYRILDELAARFEEGRTHCSVHHAVIAGQGYFHPVSGHHLTTFYNRHLTDCSDSQNA